MTAPARGGTQLLWLAEAVNATGALEAAARLGLLEFLEARPADARGVAVGCDITEHGAAVLLEALAALDLVHPVGDAPSPAFAATAGTAALVAALPHSTDLVEVIRSGAPHIAGDTVAGAAVLYPDLVAHLGTAMREAAARVAALIPRPAGRVLDVGAGAAPWSIALAARDPSCEVTAVDLPEVLPVTHRAVRGAGLLDRYKFLPGDAFSVELRPHYDLALLANMCHLFDGEVNRALLGKLRAALRPGGTVAIVDVLPSLDPKAQRSVSLYALGLLGRTSSGAVHSEDRYREWLADAGFVSTVVTQAVGHPPITLITAEARKPSEIG